MSSDLERLGWLIKRVQHLHHRELDAKLARFDISLVQWNALREIARNPEVSQHGLAERTFNSDQSFGTLLARLLARGLIEQHKKVGRATFHRLSAKGKKLLRDGQDVMSEVVIQSFSVLQKNERSELTRLLVKVLDARAQNSDR